MASRNESAAACSSRAVRQFFPGKNDVTHWKFAATQSMPFSSLCVSVVHLSSSAKGDLTAKHPARPKAATKATKKTNDRASRRGAARCCRLSPPQTGLADFPHPASPKTFSDKRAQEVMDGR